MRVSRIGAVAALLAALGTILWGCGKVDGQSDQETGAQKPHGHLFFRVKAASSVGGPLQGRLLIFVKRSSSNGAVDASEFQPETTWVAAQQLRNLEPGGTVDVDVDAAAFPQPFSALPAGKYEAQAVLDVDGSYPYSGRGPEDWASEVTPMKDWTPGSTATPLLTLDRHPGKDWTRAVELVAATTKARLIGARQEEMVSPVLSRFWGHPVSIKAWVVLPPGYARRAGETFPTAYWTHGFGGNLDHGLANGLRIYDRMKDGRMPAMIWVMLDESIPQGTHEFADSVNNGPWGTALTTEFIPYLEGKYRMDARASGRFLNGHSSGGWATLQLQVNYPRIFGGTWSTSPDSSDFHDFNGVDLYAPNANLYRKPDGSPVPVMRENGVVTATMEQIAKLEAVMGPYGGQLSSFDWVFSPRAADGSPRPMFDRQTGDVDPAVMAYWREHYDLANIVATTWAERGADLKGKIHVTVGDADTFYLDGSADRFDAVLAKLDADAHFSYLPGRTHFDVYEADGDPQGLWNQIGAEMYAVARPGVDWKGK